MLNARNQPKEKTWKVYYWNHHHDDWTPGIVVIIARDLREAKRILKKQELPAYEEFYQCKDKRKLPYWKPHKPEIFDLETQETPLIFCRGGGS